MPNYHYHASIHFYNHLSYIYLTILICTFLQTSSSFYDHHLLLVLHGLEVRLRGTIAAAPGYGDHRGSSGGLPCHAHRGSSGGLPCHTRACAKVAGIVAVPAATEEAASGEEESRRRRMLPVLLCRTRRPRRRLPSGGVCFSRQEN